MLCSRGGSSCWKQRQIRFQILLPLEATNEDSEEVETLRDVVQPPDELATLRNESSLSHLIGHNSQDPFENGIFEVYGPPSKRPRISNDPTSNTGTVISPSVDDQQSPTLLPAHQSIYLTVNDHCAISRLGTDESAANVVIATTTTNGVCALHCTVHPLVTVYSILYY